MTIREAIEKVLKENGCDGLYNEDVDCACESGDLFPCEDPETDGCKFGVKAPCDCEEGHEFHVVKRPEKVSHALIEDKPRVTRKWIEEQWRWWSEKSIDISLGDWLTEVLLKAGVEVGE